MLLFLACTNDMETASGAAKGGDFLPRDGDFGIPEKCIKCINNEAPEIQMGIYDEAFTSIEENNQLILQSDSDGGLSAIVALTLVGICPEDLIEITVSAELENATIATSTFDYFDGFCTPETTWLLPQLGLSFLPGVSLFDLIDQPVILKSNALLEDDLSISAEANVDISP